MSEEVFYKRYIMTWNKLRKFKRLVFVIDPKAFKELPYLFKFEAGYAYLEILVDTIIPSMVKPYLVKGLWAN